MVLNNLFTGEQWRNIENRLMDMGRGEERVRCMERVRWKLTFKKNDSFYLNLTLG